MTETIKEVGGHNVNLIEEGKGPTLLFLFDSWHTSTGLEPLISAASQSNRVVVADPPGFGSSPVPEGYAMETKDYAAFFGDLVDNVGGGEMTLVLSGMGVMIGLESIAEGHLQINKLGSLVLTNGLLYQNQVGGVFTSGSHPFLLRRDLPIDRMMHRRKLIHMCGEPQFMDEALVEASWYSFKKGALRSQAKLGQSVVEAIPKVPSWLSYLAETGLPVMFLWGEADPAGGKWVAKKLQEDLPDAYGYALPKIGHFPHVEAPAVLIETLRSFNQILSEGGTEAGGSEE